MTKGKKYTVSTAAFYLILAPLIIVGEHYSPSGPCTPGLGVMLFLFTVPVSGIAFLICGVNWLRGRRAWTGPLLVNAGVLAALVLVIWAGRV